MLVSLTAVERYWRRHGFTPGVIDSMQLWSLQRDQARRAAPRPLVFLGASRTLFGIDLPTVRAMLPGWQPVMLALNGRYPLAALRDLADDDAFRGTVVLDIDSRGLARYNHAAQAEYVDYYHGQWSPSWRWHRQFLNHWQGALAIGNPDLAIVRALQRRAAGQRRPELPTHTTAPDRDSQLDFALAESYRYQRRAPLPCALHVLGARRDCLSEDDLRAWRRETRGPFTLEWLDGDHAYLRPQEDELLSLIEFHASRLLRREAAGMPLGA